MDFFPTFYFSIISMHSWTSLLFFFQKRVLILKEADMLDSNVLFMVDCLQACSFRILFCKGVA